MTPESLLERLERLRERPGFAAEFFAEVAPSRRLACLKRLLHGAGEPVTLGTHAVLFHPETADERPWLILSGSLDEWSGQIRMATRRAGDLIGELPALQRGLQRQGLDAVAREPSTLLPLAPAAFEDTVRRDAGFARAVLRAVALHAAAYVDDESQFMEALRQYFPRGRGILTAGPYDCAGTVLHLFFCADAGGVDEVAAALPPGVERLASRPHYMLGVTHMGRVTQPHVPDRTPFTYDEVVVFTPVRVHGCLLPRLHVPYIFPDNLMAAFLGREIAGLPKLRASTYVDDLGGGVTRLLMRRLGANQLDIRFREVPLDSAPVPDWPLHDPARVWGLLLDPARRAGEGPALAEAMGLRALRALHPRLPWSPAYAPPVRVTAWKRIFDPSARYEGPRRWRRRDFQVDALCEIPFHVRTVREIRLLELVDGGIHTHPDFPVGACRPLSRYGLRVQMDMTMAPGRVLLDYRRRPRFWRSDRLTWGPG